MKRALLGVVLLCLSSALPSAQVEQRALKPGTGVVVGRVVDADSGRPVRGAIVRLEGGDGFHISPVLTDNDGKFVYTRLVGSDYSFSATKGGYHEASYGQLRARGSGQMISLADGERRGDVVIRMWRYSAITGTVRDETGEPLVGVWVHAYSRTFVAGRPQLTEHEREPVLTDDRGVYRLGLLEPGDYVVAIPLVETSVPLSLLEDFQAVPSANKEEQMAFATAFSALGLDLPRPIASGRVTVVGNFVRAYASGAVPPPASGRDGSLFSYPTTYYPGVRVDTEAQPITMRAGDERTGVDFELKPMRTVRVAGKVTSTVAPVARVTLTLLPVSSDGSVGDQPVAQTITDAQGAFTFLGVPAGEFQVHSLRLPPDDDFGFVEVLAVSDSGSKVTMAEEAMLMRPITPPKPDPSIPSVLWASARISVGGRDVSGVSVPLRAGLRVSGRVEFEGLSREAAAKEFDNVRVSAIAADGRQLPRTSGFKWEQPQTTTFAVDKDGMFHELLAPGTYVLRPTGNFKRIFEMGGDPAVTRSEIGGLGTISVTLAESAMAGPWLLSAARVNGRDLTDSPLPIGDSDVDGIVLTLTRRAASISGTVRNPASASEPDAMVVLFPVNSDWWVNYGNDDWRVRRLRAARDGSYRFDALPPGEYYIAAVGEDDRSPSPDPQWLARLSRVATRVTLTAGETRTQPLTLTPGR